jgi:Mg2+/Co2+ transporter CorB
MPYSWWFQKNEFKQISMREIANETWYIVEVTHEETKLLKNTLKFRSDF